NNCWLPGISRPFPALPRGEAGVRVEAAAPVEVEADVAMLLLVAPARHNRIRLMLPQVLRLPALQAPARAEAVAEDAGVRAEGLQMRRVKLPRAHWPRPSNRAAPLDISGRRRVPVIR